MVVEIRMRSTYAVRMALVAGHDRVVRRTPSLGRPFTAQWRTTAQYAGYVRAEVRHAPVLPPLPGPLAGFTNPVFLGR
jgi:hypothetical protein